MNQHLEGALDGQQASWMSLHTNKIQVKTSPTKNFHLLCWCWGGDDAEDPGEDDVDVDVDVDVHTNKIQVKTSPTKVFTSSADVEVETTLNGTQVVKGEGEVSSDGKKVSVRLGGRDVVYE